MKFVANDSDGFYEGSLSSDKSGRYCYQQHSPESHVVGCVNMTRS